MTFNTKYRWELGDRGERRGERAAAAAGREKGWGGYRLNRWYSQNRTVSVVFHFLFSTCLRKATLWLSLDVWSNVLPLGFAQQDDCQWQANRLERTKEKRNVDRLDKELLLIMLMYKSSRKEEHRIGSGRRGRSRIRRHANACLCMYMVTKISTLVEDTRTEKADVEEEERKRHRPRRRRRRRRGTRKKERFSLFALICMYVHVYMSTHTHVITCQKRASDEEEKWFLTYCSCPVSAEMASPYVSHVANWSSTSYRVDSMPTSYVDKILLIDRGIDKNLPWFIFCLFW